MDIPFSRWPEDRASRYREKGYWQDEPLTQIIHNQSRKTPHATAVICGDRRISYVDMDRLSTNMASQIAKRGFGPGDTALVQLPNVAEFYITFFALLKAGVAPVNALFNHRRIEMTAYAEQIKPRLLIASRDHELFHDNRFVAELETLIDAPIISVFDGENDGEHSLQHWCNTPTDARATPTPASDVAFFQLSGGSTGTPKLIPRTHNDYLYSASASADICHVTHETRFLCAIPAAHNYALSSPGALGVFYKGGCVVLAPNPSAQTCFPLLMRHDVTMVALVPPALSLWLQAARTREAHFTALSLIQVGGASLAESVARQVPEVFGCQLQQVFGMAEGLVNYTRLDDPDDVVFTTQGRPVSADDEIKIITENGELALPGETGVLATRGPYTFGGYYNSPAHNAQAFDSEGFYYSGDLVCMTPEGNIRVVGRVKDQVNRGGEKVASEEIESLILRHPSVTHAALVAIPDALMGEKTCVFIVSSDGNMKPVMVRKYLMEIGVADYKVPDRVQFIDKMPLTAVGKIDKKALRETLRAASL